MSNKARKFKVDDWVLFCLFPESEFETLRNDRKRAVVLQVLPRGGIYDYEIYIDDGSSKIKKVREECLFEVEK